MNSTILASITFALCSLTPGVEPFELRDGDRIVLVGNTLIEREQRYGYWEAALTARWPDRNITFRNLGWSGDTVWGDARAGFDTRAEGFRRLVQHTLALRPTVIILGYGGNEAFAGPDGMSAFQEGLNRLLAALAPAKARLVLLAPLRIEDHVGPLTNAATLNAHLTLYRDVLQRTATAGGHRFVDLFVISGQPHGIPQPPLTDNGLHLSTDGYRRSARWLEEGLGLPARRDLLSEKQADRLRQTIVAKNQQYFYRWRPQNETYLFGFRKHEQGKNAAEVPLFDPIVEKLEKDIARLRMAERIGQ